MTEIEVRTVDDASVEQDGGVVVSVVPMNHYSVSAPGRSEMVAVADDDTRCITFTSHGGGHDVVVDLVEGGDAQDVSLRLSSKPGYSYVPYITFPNFHREDANRISCHPGGGGPNNGTAYGERLQHTISNPYGGYYTPGHPDYVKDYPWNSTRTGPIFNDLVRVDRVPFDHFSYCETSSHFEFHDGNWDKPRTLHLKAGHDEDSSDHTYIITFVAERRNTVTGYVESYWPDLPSTITVRITDDDDALHGLFAPPEQPDWAPPPDVNYGQILGSFSFAWHPDWALQPAVSVAATAAGSEGDPVTFDIEARPPPMSPLDVNVILAHTGSALPDSEAGPRSVTVPEDGFLSLAVPTVDDDVRDGNTVTLTIEPGHGYILGHPHRGTADVRDSGEPVQDSPPLPSVVSLASSAPAGAEGDPISYVIEARPPPVSPLLIRLNVSHTGDILADAHAGLQNATVPANGSLTVIVPTLDDSVNDTNTITITILEGGGYLVDPASYGVTIDIPDDDAAAREPMAVAIDPALITKVKAMAAQSHHGHEHVDRWTRVLAAFGEAEHDSPMTAAEARENAGIYSSPLWPLVADALAARE